VRGLSGKVVIVTGGGGGIGTATCNRFAQEGAKVAVFDIDGCSADRTAAQITEAGGKAEAFACDITKHAACQRAVDAAEKAIGPADILVNNAGWDVFRPFVETSPSGWQKITSINLTGALNLHHDRSGCQKSVGPLFPALCRWASRLALYRAVVNAILPSTRRSRTQHNAAAACSNG
jgi:NAD(P)-dependent dehydrogenase (short-subunit alcohol dehydrogenase family)